MCFQIVCLVASWAPHVIKIKDCRYRGAVLSMLTLISTLSLQIRRKMGMDWLLTCFKPANEDDIYYNRNKPSSVVTADKGNKVNVDTYPQRLLTCFKAIETTKSSKFAPTDTNSDDNGVWVRLLLCFKPYNSEGARRSISSADKETSSSPQPGTSLWISKIIFRAANYSSGQWK